MGLFSSKNTEPTSSSKQNFDNISQRSSHSQSNISLRIDKDSDDDSSSSSSSDNISTKSILNLLEKFIVSIQNYKNKHICGCDKCEKMNFNHYRYKCLVCYDYDLCSICFEKDLTNKDHELWHPVARFEEPMVLFQEKIENTGEVTLEKLILKYKNEQHQDVQCDICGEENIKGLRFKCSKCRNFDLCLSCYHNKKESDKHKLNHPLIVIGKSSIQQLDIKDIELNKLLGSGAFGSVFKAKFISTGKEVACKIINCDPNKIGLAKCQMLSKSYQRELNAYNEIKAINILRMIGTAIEETENSFKFYIVTELMARGSLESLLKSEKDLSNRRKLDISFQIARGMEKIHSLNYIHRDIRPDNILISNDYTPKIGDMGILIDMETNNTFTGCIPFMPPEFFEGNYDQKLDVFTFGLTLNQIYEGENHSTNPRGGKIKTKPSIFSFLVDKCVNYDPEKRLCSTTIVKVLEVFLQSIDQEILSNEYIFSSKEEKNKLFKIAYIKTLQNIIDRQSDD